MSQRADLIRKTRRALAVGPSGVVQRLAQRAFRQSGAADLVFNLDWDDLLVDVPDELPVPLTRPKRGQALRIGWVTTPPAAGSGGHTTLFRIVEALEAEGHICVLFLYDKHGLDAARLTAGIRENWPGLHAEVRDARAGIGGIDAVVATSWESAHVVVKYGRSPMRRLYFMQDYEPYFYGHGAESAFAEMTYRLPFRRIALGEMLGGMLHEQTGLASDVVPFGCDSAVYHLPAGTAARTGIVFYCRPDHPRRGYQLAYIALMVFHRRHPDQEIHVFGAHPRGLRIPFTYHGRLSTDALNDLYGRTIAGLAMSFTNITLVAEEMLSAGNIPVVNNIGLARQVLPSPYVRWAEPTANALADELSAAVAMSDLAGHAVAAAASVVGRSWKPTQDAVVRIIVEEVAGA